MKNTLKIILALAMVFCMLFTVVGCGDDGKEASSQQAAGEGFFDDEVTQNQKEETTSNVASDDKSSTGNKPVSTVVPEENKVGGKTWKEVLASMPKKLAGTKLVMYNWNPAVEYTGAPAAIDAFTKQTGIKVEWRTINYSQYFTKLPALIASGENIPDMVRLRGPKPDFIQHMQPLSVTKYDFNDQAWDKLMLDLYTFNGKSYGVSLQNTHVGSINLMFYNKSLMKKHFSANEDPYKLWKDGKWTWSKYVEMCKKFKKETGNPGSNGEGHFSTYLTCWGISGAIRYNGKIYENNFVVKKDKNGKEDPVDKKRWNKFLEVHKTLGDLYNKDKVFAHGGEESFNKGSVLFSIGTAVHARKKNSYFGNLKAANTLYMVPMPKIDGQKTYYQGFGEAEAYGIAKGAPNPQAVPYFLRYFLDGANYELSTYFGNTQNLEVYNWCMNQKNKVVSYGYPSEIGKIDGDGVETQPGTEMPGKINSSSGTVQKMVDQYNATAGKIK